MGPRHPVTDQMASGRPVTSSCLPFLISEGPGQAHFMSFVKLSHVGPSDASVWGGVRTQQRAGNTQT